MDGVSQWRMADTAPWRNETIRKAVSTKALLPRPGSAAANSSDQGPTPIFEDIASNADDEDAPTLSARAVVEGL